MTRMINCLAAQATMPDDIPWDYILKKTNGHWKARNDRGQTLAKTSTNTSMETLLNAILTDKGADYGKIAIDGKGTVMNIDGSFSVPSNTILQGMGPRNWAGFFLSNGGNCNMIEPVGGPGDDDIGDVIIDSIYLDANKLNNTGGGEISCLDWRLGNADKGSWAMISLYRSKFDDAYGHVVDIGGNTGGLATFKIIDCKFYQPRYTYFGLHFDNAWDGMMSNCLMANLKCENAFTSNHINNIYLAGGDQSVPNLYLTNSKCAETTWDGIRSDWCNDHAIHLDNADNNSFGTIEVTQQKTYDNARTAMKFSGSSQYNVVESLMVGFRATRNAFKWQYGVSFEETAAYNIIESLQCGVGVTTAEVYYANAYHNVVKTCTGSLGKIGRAIY